MRCRFGRSPGDPHLHCGVQFRKLAAKRKYRTSLTRQKWSTNIVRACGHFAAWERPAIFAEEMRPGLKSLRQPHGR